MKRLLFPLFLAVLLVSTPARAATILLSGSDTISLHAVTSEAAAAYNFLSNAGAGAVLLVNDFGAGAGYGGAGFGAFTSVSSLVGVTLSDYAGIMFASPGGCCDDPGAFIVGFEASLAAYSGNLYVEDYLGGGGVGGATYAASWATVLGFDGTGGEIADTGCTGDPGVPTAQGLAFGYVGGSFGCYLHQIYDPAFFAPFGYVSLVDGCSFSGVCGSVILGSGRAAEPVPEPATLALVVTGLLTSAGVRGVRRRKLNTTARRL